MVKCIIFPALIFPANVTSAFVPHINIAEERTIEAVRGLGLAPPGSEPPMSVIIDINIIVAYLRDAVC